MALAYQISHRAIEGGFVRSAKEIVAIALYALVMFQPASAKAEASSALSQAEEAKLDQISNRFFGDLRTGKTEAAVLQFFANTKLMQSKTSELRLLASQIDGAITLYGKLGQCELEKTSQRGSLAQYRNYICSHEDFSTYWSMAFFKTSSGWIAANIAFKDMPLQPE